MAPADHERYRPGTSWLEETGMSLNEFRSAFDSIGYRHTSKSSFMSAEDKFFGRMYASYVDKRTNLTHYFRNHALVDQRLDELVARLQCSGQSFEQGQASTQSQVIDFKADAKSVSPVNAKSKSPVDADSISPVNRIYASPGDSISKSQEIGKLDPQEMQFPDLPTTDTTVTEPTRQLQQTAAAAPANTGDQVSRAGSSSVLTSQEQPKKLIYPNLTGKELKEIESILEFCRPEMRQDVLDEIEGIRLTGGIKRGAVPLARTLVKRVTTAEFALSAGVKVQAARENRLAHEDAIRYSATATVEACKATIEPTTEDAIRMLPPNIQARARALSSGVPG